MTGGLVVALAIGLCAPVAARASVPGDLCTGNPCNVTGTITVDAESVLDFGATTDLRVKGSATLQVGPSATGVSAVKLRARSIVLEPGANLLGGANTVHWLLEATSGNVDIQGSGSNVAKIDLSGFIGGYIEILAQGDITVSGSLDVGGTGSASSGGDIAIAAQGSVTINAGIQVGARNSDSTGGSLDVEANGPVVINGILDSSSPSDAGAISILSSLADVTVNKKIDASGGNPDGSGGAITIEATNGGLFLNAQLLSTAGNGPDDACGDGGDLTLTSGLDTTIAGDVNLSGGAQCSGGTLTEQAGGAFTQLQTSSIVANGPGQAGTGGSLNLQAAMGATLRNIDISSPGIGGIAEVLAAGGVVSLLGKLDASGSGPGSLGGVVEIQGCNVTVAATGRIDSRGDVAVPGTGLTMLKAGGTLTVAGTLQAQDTNELRTKVGAPIVTGTVTPAAVIVLDPTLPDCAQLARCGDGHLDPDEVCDDGNTQNCDGCTADCRRVDAVCGDGLAECGEQCDDGNTDPNDGCNNACQLPGTTGARIVGSPRPNTGCFAEWELSTPNPVLNSSTGLPSSTQSCVDGDTSCDADGQNNLSCSFGVRICLRVADPRLPACSPDPITLAMLKFPRSLTSGAQLDPQNATTIVNALKTLGGTVRIGSTTVQVGPALAGFDNCTPSFHLFVPRKEARTGGKRFNILADDVGGTRMQTNQLTLECLRNTAVCGNHVLEPTEACDDGNAVDCDGCSATCTIERCGDGIVQCNEQCDDGPANGTPSSLCSTSCTGVPPPLRIPGSGTASLDCGFEWALEMAPNDVVFDTKGRPKTLQTCHDNDPRCDFDPTPGSCRMHVWGCVGGDDQRLACTALQATGFSVLAPLQTAAKPNERAASVALTNAGHGLTFPAPPGENCTSRVDVDVPVSKRTLSFKVRTQLVHKKVDTDLLMLRCLAPPVSSASR